MPDNIFVKHFDLVIFFYGLAFIMLGAILFSQIRATKKSEFRIVDILWLLAWFGITHGLNEFLDMFALVGKEPPLLAFLHLAVLISSYLFLAIFGYKLINIARKEAVGVWYIGITTFSFFELPLVLGSNDPTVWTIAARYFLGLPGAILTAISFVMYYQKEKMVFKKLRVINYFIIAALSFGAYGVLSGLIVSQSSFFPASIINDRAFLLWTGIPVQLLRLVCAIIITWSIWNMMNLFNIEEEASRVRAQEELKRDSDTQTAINSLLRLSLEDIPLDEILRSTLDLLLSIPWLALESRGAIFTVEGDEEVLTMKAQRGLSDYIQKSCSRVPFGKCVCGMAAATREVQFRSDLDETHVVTYEGIKPHGHYCVPIIVSGKILGVINLYIHEGRERKQREVEFLTAVANALAGVIERKRGEDRIKALLGETQKANEALKKMDKSKDEFLSIVTHDLKTPLVSIMGYSDLMLKGMAGEVREELRKYIEIIRRQGEALQQMIDTILDYTRLEFGKIKVSRELFPVNSWLAAQIETIKPAANHKKIGLETKFLPEDVQVNWDKGMMSRVISNLLGNALKYTSEGGKLVVSSAQNGKMVELSIRDSGIGIAADDLPKVFEKFYLIDAAGARANRSLGLGLYIVKSFVEAHGGMVKAESAGLSRGSTFSLTVPIG